MLLVAYAWMTRGVLLCDEWYGCIDMDSGVAVIRIDGVTGGVGNGVWI